MKVIKIDSSASGIQCTKKAVKESNSLDEENENHTVTAAPRSGMLVITRFGLTSAWCLTH